jgi:undecaprenyl diphosphate synthase
VPQHVAVIMDGNGRWAQARGMSRRDGHRAGAENLRAIIERFAEHGVPVLTLWAFSTENWGRPRPEVDALMRLGAEYIDEHLSELEERDVRVRHIGDLDRLPGPLRKRIRHAVNRTKNNRRITVNLAFNYGGRADIVGAVRRLLALGAKPEEVTEEAISAHLAAADLPEPDLVIRTGGESRVSNFLIWQAAYAEYYFSETLWPDFDVDEVDEALTSFSLRSRRFGATPDDANGATRNNKA